MIENLKLAMRSSPYVLFHLACLLVFTTGVSWEAVGILLTSYWLRMIGVSVGYHRLFSHKAFKTSRVFQFILAVLGAASLQRGPFWWAWTHRYHHRHTDTPRDLHSPNYQGVAYSYWGWIFNKQNLVVPKDAVMDLKAFPELRFIEHRVTWVGISLLYAWTTYFLFGWTGLVWGYSLSTIMIWHSVHWVQVLSHNWAGYRRYESADQSRNHWLLGLMTLGEYHNNHHAFAWSARQGHAWWELDLGYILLKFLEKIGIVWDLKTPSEKRMIALTTVK